MTPAAFVLGLLLGGVLAIVALAKTVERLLP